jgi:hypothetical protein
MGRAAEVRAATIDNAAGVFVDAYRIDLADLDDQRLLEVARAIAVVRGALAEIEARVLLAIRGDELPRLSWRQLAVALGYRSPEAVQGRYRLAAARHGRTTAEYLLTYERLGWSVRADGQLTCQHGGLRQDQVDEARNWAGEMIAVHTGRGVIGWVTPAGVADGEHLARLGPPGIPRYSE